MSFTRVDDKTVLIFLKLSKKGVTNLNFFLYALDMKAY